MAPPGAAYADVNEPFSAATFQSVATSMTTTAPSCAAAPHGNIVEVPTATIAATIGTVATSRVKMPIRAVVNMSTAKALRPTRVARCRVGRPYRARTATAKSNTCTALTAVSCGKRFRLNSQFEIANSGLAHKTAIKATRRRSTSDGPIGVATVMGFCVAYYTEMRGTRAASADFGLRTSDFA